MTFWTLFFCKHPHFISIKPFCNKNSVICKNPFLTNQSQHFQVGLRGLPVTQIVISGIIEYMGGGGGIHNPTPLLFKVGLKRNFYENLNGNKDFILDAVCMKVFYYFNHNIEIYYFNGTKAYKSKSLTRQWKLRNCSKEWNALYNIKGK